MKAILPIVTHDGYIIATNILVELQMTNLKYILKMIWDIIIIEI